MTENGWDIGAHLLAEAGNAMDDKDVEIERLRALVAAAEAQEWKELQKARATIADLTAALEAITRRTWPSTRTHDQSISDMELANDIARAALARAQGGKE